MSLNGRVTVGKWVYIANAKALLLDRVEDKILLNQAFVNNDVMVLSQDGVLDDNFILVNELQIPNLDVLSYLKRVYYKANAIRVVDLADGTQIEVHNVKDSTLVGFSVTKNIDENVEDGRFTTIRGNIVEVKSGKLLRLLTRTNITLSDSTIFISEHDLKGDPLQNGNHLYMLDGTSPVLNGKYKISSFNYLTIENGVIKKSSIL
jgi:hypothetical protein